MKSVTLSMTTMQHSALAAHLFPADGNEAVAFALCGRADSSKRHRLLVRRVVPIPHNVCSTRAPDRVTWPTEVLLPLIDEVSRNGEALVKIHGHRGYSNFSDVDDLSDTRLLALIQS